MRSGMRFVFLLLISIVVILSACSEPEDPELTVVETLEVEDSFSSSRTFRGSVEYLAEGDSVIAYGFEWESRYGNWKAKKHRRISKGTFSLKDTTRLSKWNKFSVRAFLETKNGITYGNEVGFSTEGN